MSENSFAMKGYDRYYAKKRYIPYYGGYDYGGHYRRFRRYPYYSNFYLNSLNAHQQSNRRYNSNELYAKNKDYSDFNSAYLNRYNKRRSRSGYR